MKLLSVRQWVILAAMLLFLVGNWSFRPAPETNLESAALLPGQDPAHPLGTDKLGRDLLDLTARGGLETVVTVIPARLGTILLGLLCLLPAVFSVQVDAGRFSRISAAGFGYAAEILQVIPSLLLALILAGMLPKSFISVSFAVILSDWPYLHRSSMKRMEELASREATTASVALGAGLVHRVRFHILPEFSRFLIRQFFTGLPGVVLTIATLSFLGIGEETGWFGAEGWGSQIALNRAALLDDARLVLVPGAALAILVLAVTPLSLFRRGPHA